MENKLIVAVCSRPVMYDTTDYNYRNRNMKEDAWKSISEEIGVPVEACRKKWKNLRDMYLKEKKKDSDKKSGSAAFAWKKWKYSASLSFLDPFLSPRETSGNTDPGFQEQTSDCDLMPPVEEDEEEEAAAAVAKLTEAEETSGFEDGISPSPEAKSPLAVPAAAPLAPGSPSSSSASSPAPPGTSSSAAGSTKPPRRKRRQTQEDTNIDRQILQILKDGPKNISATENFFLSLIPMMEQLPPRRQEMVKMRFQSILFEELYGSNN